MMEIYDLFLYLLQLSDIESLKKEVFLMLETLKVVMRSGEVSEIVTFNSLYILYVNRKKSCSEISGIVLTYGQVHAFKGPLRNNPVGDIPLKAKLLGFDI